MDFTSWDAGMHSADPNALQHYGVSGMKWGQRRYQNEDGSLTSLGKERYGKQGYASAGQVKRALNKLDKEQAEAKYRARQIGHVDRIERLKKKVEKATSAGRTDKVAKYNSKIAKLRNLSPEKRAKMNKYYKLADKSKNMTNKILRKAKDLGYDVKSKAVMRAVHSNRDHVLNAISSASAISMAMLTAAYGPSINVMSQAGRHVKITSYKFGVGIAPAFGGRAEGKQYKVKKNKGR